MPVNSFDCTEFIERGGRIPAPIHSFKKLNCITECINGKSIIKELLRNGEYYVRRVRKV